MATRRGSGEGSIYQRESDGKWCAVVTVGYVNGKRKRKPLYGKTRKEVAEKLKAVLRDQQQGLPIATPRQTVKQFLTHWLEDTAKPKLAPKSYQSYAGEIHRNIIPALGHLQLDKLTPQDVQRFLNALATRGGAAGQGLSARTVAYNRAILRKALGQALKWGNVPRNVATLIDPPKTKRPDVQPYTPDEARRLLATARGDRLEALYAVALELGLRQGELLGLTWADVDLTAGKLHVRRQLQWLTGERPVLKDLKTRGSRRTLDLSPALVAELRAHHDRQRLERHALSESWQNWGPSLVFPSAVGTPIVPRNLTRHYKKLIQRAEVPERRFHDLRHTCASLLLAEGIEAAIVSRVLGHASIAITVDTYMHLMPQTRRQVATVMSGVLRAAQ